MLEVNIFQKNRTLKLAGTWHMQFMECLFSHWEEGVNPFETLKANDTDDDETGSFRRLTWQASVKVSGGV